VRGPAGFSVLELIVVLLLMGILAATIASRSVTLANMDLGTATDQVRSHLRFAQADAMKSRDVRGISSSGTQYWFFTGTNPANEVRLPGVEYSGASNRLSEAQLKATLSDFTVFFDRIGKPYLAYTDAAVNTPLPATLSVNLSAGAESRTITITPETGLIR
jgi:MSHA pilin protein MshC